MHRGQVKRYHITARWLVQHGCAHDPLEEPSAEPAAVEIFVDPNAWFFRIGNIQPGFMVWVELAARKPAVHVEEVSFELRDFSDVQFSLLPSPERPREAYSFSGGEYSFEPECVLNTAIPGTLRQNYPWKGWLLGVADKPLPAGLFGRMPVEVKAWDEFGTLAGSAQFEIALLPEEPCRRNSNNKRKGLYEPLEGEEGTGPEVPLPREPLIVPGIVNELIRHRDARRLTKEEAGNIRLRSEMR